jgi:hypothetical protein
LWPVTGESPNKKKRLGEGKGFTGKTKRTEKPWKELLTFLRKSVQVQYPLPDAEILKLLRVKCQGSATYKGPKVTILNVLLKRWSIQKVQKVLQSASYCMMRTAERLVADQGIRSLLNPKPGKTLDELTPKL